MKIHALVGAAAIAVLLAGCTGGPNDDGPVTGNTGDGDTGDSGTGTSADDCGGLTTEALEAVFGVSLDGPETERGNNDQNGVTWTDNGCDWENDAADLELDLDISVASDFPDGKLGCVDLGGIGDIAPVDGIGTQAWWEFGDINEAEGTLRVCTADALIDFEVDAESGSWSSDELRDAALEVIRPIVEG
ncbi:hypothetical protein GCM10022239_22520 [Leifsonia bigeumensis]|uniref:DUF3558 domain-containing protein n=1 Tax=Leifsonella bigeumensis TaxID=433643 RepID=A0ABP7FT98_9MICO